nr:hypothetical protein [Xenorhabdus lircayensis]
MAKADISLNRMSEDIDIKLMPRPEFEVRYSCSRRRNIRKYIVQTILESVTSSGVFSFDEEYSKTTCDEYRYNDIPLRYPQRLV